MLQEVDEFSRLFLIQPTPTPTQFKKRIFMPFADTLRYSLESYGFAKHDEIGSTKYIVKQLNKKITRINKEENHERKLYLDAKLLNLCRCYVVYMETTNTSLDLRSRLKHLTLKQANDFTDLTSQEILNKTLKCYQKDSKCCSRKKRINEILSIYKASRAITQHHFKDLNLFSHCANILIRQKDRHLVTFMKDVDAFSRKHLALISSDSLSTSASFELNPVEINIWMPNFNSVGHVSMKLSDTKYVSSWPIENTSGIKKLTTGVEGIHHTYLEDLKAEGHPETIKLRFFSLDVEAMIQGFEIIKKRKWHAFAADAIFSNKFKKLGNCGSIIASLLVLGGIRDLFPEKKQKNVFPTTPNKEKLWEILNNERSTSLCGKESDKCKNEEKGKEKTSKNDLYKIEIYEVESYITFIGEKALKALDKSKVRKQVIPSRFVEHLANASQLDEKKCGNALIEFYKQNKVRKKEIKDKLRIFTGKNVDKVLAEYFSKFLKLNAKVSSSGERFKNTIANAINIKGFIPFHDSAQNTLLHGNLFQVYMNIKTMYKHIIDKCLQNPNEIKPISEIYEQFFSNFEQILFDTCEPRKIKTKKGELDFYDPHLPEKKLEKIWVDCLENEKKIFPPPNKPRYRKKSEYTPSMPGSTSEVFFSTINQQSNPKCPQTQNQIPLQRKLAQYIPTQAYELSNSTPLKPDLRNSTSTFTHQSHPLKNSESIQHSLPTPPTQQQVPLKTPDYKSKNNNSQTPPSRNLRQTHSGFQGLNSAKPSPLSPQENALKSPQQTPRERSNPSIQKPFRPLSQNIDGEGSVREKAKNYENIFKNSSGGQTPPNLKPKTRTSNASYSSIRSSATQQPEKTPEKAPSPVSNTKKRGTVFDKIQNIENRIKTGALA